MIKLLKYLLFLGVLLRIFFEEEALAYIDTIHPEELYSDSSVSSDAAVWFVWATIFINGGFFFMLWIKKKRIENSNLQNLRKFIDNPSTPDSLRGLKDIRELYLKMNSMEYVFSKLDADKKEREINERGEYVGFILQDHDKNGFSSGYIVFKLEK